MTAPWWLSLPFAAEALRLGVTEARQRAAHLAHAARRSVAYELHGLATLIDVPTEPAPPKYGATVTILDWSKLDAGDAGPRVAGAGR